MILTRFRLPNTDSSECCGISRTREDGGSLKDLSEQELNDLRGPRGIGRTAPEIEGHDFDGKPFKLSDYRGRVIVLSFSGHWCGPCRLMHPHEQALVERFAEEPFALLEVNSDDDKDSVQRRMSEKNLTWRCCWDRSTSGPISEAWDIREWPVFYVIDSSGVIRHKAVGAPGSELEKWVAALLQNRKSAVPDGR